MEDRGTLIDMLLDGVTDPKSLKEAIDRTEAERERVVALIEAGEYELLLDED